MSGRRSGETPLSLGSRHEHDYDHGSRLAVSRGIDSPWALLWPYLSWLIGLLIVICMATVAEATGLILLSALLNLFMYPHGEVGSVSLFEPIYLHARLNPRLFLLLLVAVYMVKSLFALAGTYGSFSLALRIADDWRMRLVRAFLGVPLKRLGSRQGGMLQIVLDEPGTVALGLGATGLLLQNLLSMLSVYAVLLYVSPLVTMGLTAIGLAALVTLAAISRYSLRLGEHRSMAYRDGYGHFAEMLSSIKQFRTFDLEAEAEVQAASHLAHMRGVQLKLNVLSSSPRLLIEILFLCGLAATIVVLTPRMGEASVLSALGLAVAATIRLLPSFSASASTWVQVQQAWPAMTNIARELARLEGTGGAERTTPAGLPVSFHDRIAVCGVAFSYPDREPALAGVDLEIECGTFTAIVGPSGAGKSTLVDLICGFYDPNAGQITVDGVDLREVSLSSWRRQLGVVLQDGFLLSGTVRDNLCLLRPDCPEDLLLEIVGMVGADTFIRELSDGYDTRVGERGVQLSGGQRQRLALARALLRQPRVLILDEAMSALDLESEEALQNALESLRGRLTMIVIAHRLSTVRRADRIYVLDGGKVVESGQHEALLVSGGLYAAMWRKANFSPGEGRGDALGEHST